MRLYASGEKFVVDGDITFASIARISIGQGVAGIPIGSVDEPKTKDAVRLEKDVIKQYGVPRGVLLTSMGKDTPAARAGLAQNDVITAIAGTPIASQQQMYDALSTHPAGSTIEIVYVRNKIPATAKVTLIDIGKNSVKAKIVSISVENADDADRVAKGLTHAVELCHGGKKDELF